jgi:ATP-dependent DNA helicase RecG
VNNIELNQILKQGEGPMVEFKEAQTALPGNLFETVCAFLNRDGGTILLGVSDEGAVIGVEPDAVGRFQRDIVNLSNNPQKLDPPSILRPITIEYEGKKVIVLEVPASKQTDSSQCRRGV